MRAKKRSSSCEMKISCIQKYMYRVTILEHFEYLLAIFNEVK